MRYMPEPQDNRQRAINMLTEMALPLDEGRIQMIADMLAVWKVGEAVRKLAEMRVALQKLVNDRRKRATSYQDLKDAETHLAEAERMLAEGE